MSNEQLMKGAKSQQAECDGQVEFDGQAWWTDGRTPIKSEYVQFLA